MQVSGDDCSVTLYEVGAEQASVIV